MDRRLEPSSRVDEGEWIASRLTLDLGVTALVPPGFDAYARILHPVPLRGRPGQRNEKFVTWSEVARRTRKTMHPLAQFVSIAGKPRSTLRERAGVGEPRVGHLEAGPLTRLCAVLADHTAAPEDCWFALWAGYGWISGSPAIAEMTLVDPSGTPQSGTRSRPPTKPGDPGYVGPALPEEFRSGPLLHLPHREYLLFHGPLEAAPAMGHRPRPDVSFPQSPNLFWPADRTWCVATEIDLDSTYVGGPTALADAIVADRGIEAFRVHPTDGLDHASDTVNPYLGSRYDR